MFTIFPSLPDLFFFISFLFSSVKWFSVWAVIFFLNKISITVKRMTCFWNWNMPHSLIVPPKLSIAIKKQVKMETKRQLQKKKKKQTKQINHFHSISLFSYRSHLLQEYTSQTCQRNLLFVAVICDSKLMIVLLVLCCWNSTENKMK